MKLNLSCALAELAGPAGDADGAYFYILVHTKHLADYIYRRPSSDRSCEQTLQYVYICIRITCCNVHFTKYSVFNSALIHYLATSYIVLTFESSGDLVINFVIVSNYCNHTLQSYIHVIFILRNL